MIFDGTLDRFPQLKFCGAHAGGYLPSYLGRTDVTCDARANANCANKKHPRDYFKGQILADSMVFSDEGLRHLVAEMGVEPGRLRHRHAVQLARECRSDPQGAVPERRRQGSDPGREPGQAAATHLMEGPASRARWIR